MTKTYDNATLSKYLVGCVVYFPLSSPPEGYLKANGAAISRTTYADLFDVIGTTFGSGDGSTTFNLPDLRGEFLRCWDDSRGIDSGRTIGTGQADSFQGHRHLVKEQGGTQVIGSTLNTVGGGAGTVEAPNSHGGINRGNTEARDIISDLTNGTPRIASETRPRNISLLACIKY